MNTQFLRYIFPMVVLFLLISLSSIAGKQKFSEWDMNAWVVFWGNLILFAVSMMAFLASVRFSSTPDPKQAVKAVYFAFIIRFFVLAVAALLYILISGKNVNLPALFICVILYILYTMFEKRAFMKFAREKRNA
ncbi:MAG: hypothetical protein N2747_07150 [Chitinophagaceae bacterium]|nr:hypothetical protein [Chitinophagaceae bacterium]